MSDEKRTRKKYITDLHENAQIVEWTSENPLYPSKNMNTDYS